MGRGERWRAMSRKLMDAVHCTIKCFNICLSPNAGVCGWIPQGGGALYLVFRHCKLAEALHLLRAKFLFYNF